MGWFCPCLVFNLTFLAGRNRVKFFDAVLKFELPNALFLNFLKNSALFLIRPVLIIRDCMYSKTPFGRHCRLFLVKQPPHSEKGFLHESLWLLLCVLFWLFENDGDPNLIPLCFTSSQLLGLLIWRHSAHVTRSLSPAKWWHLAPRLEF